MVLNIISLNARGLSEYNKRKRVLEYYRKRCNVLCLQETHTNIEKEGDWENQWGGRIVFSHGDTKARGVAILIKPNSDIQCKKIWSDEAGRILIAELIVDGKTIIICNIYAPNTDSPGFFIDVCEKLNIYSEKIIIGDFNLVMNTDLDRKNSHYNNVKAQEALNDCIQEYIMQDPWRTRNPDKKRYSWYKIMNQKDVRASRIDFSLIPKGLTAQVHDTYYLNGLESDHSALFLGFDFTNHERGPSYWKFNVTLLGNMEYIEFMRKILKEAEIKYQNLEPRRRWEYYKQDIKRHTMKFSKTLASDRRIVISQLSEKICEYEEQLDNISVADLQLLENSKIELNQLQTEHVNGIIFRSRVKWIEEGERNSKYFLALEKAKYNAKACSALFKEDGQITTDQEEILNMQRAYYQELYTQDKSVVTNVQGRSESCIPEDKKEGLDKPFCYSELADAVKALNNGKVPGSDGIPVDFYKIFYRDIHKPLMQAITEAFKEETIHNSARKGILNLIPKADRDTRYLKNVRPITLLNSDYKVVEKMLANRIVPWLRELIGEDQRGFIPTRKGIVNIRKMMDIIQQANDENKEVIILQADIQKAFDKVEFSAIEASLAYFGFPDYIIKWIKILYKDFYVQVQNSGFLSEKIYVQRSVHQGGPLSAALFICVIELLAERIRNDTEIKGAYIKDIENILNLFADDTDLSLNAEEDTSLRNVLQHFEEFRKMTGLSINYDKTNIYRVGSLKNTDAKFYTANQLNWTNEPISVLGIKVSNDGKEAMQDNYNKVLEKTKRTLQRWKKRKISLIGKIGVVNSLVASLFVYPMMVLEKIPEKTVKKAEEIIEKYLWDGHKPKIPLHVLQLDKQSGGLNLVNLRIKDTAIKASWIRIGTDDAQVQEIMTKTLAPKIGNLLWKCNIKEEDVDGIIEGQKVNGFWTDVLKAWCKFNYMEEMQEGVDEPIWFNSNIRIDKKPIFVEKAFLNGLLWCHQLFENGKPISVGKAAMLYKLSLMEYNSIISAMPKNMKAVIAARKKDTEKEILSNYQKVVNNRSATKLIYRSLNRGGDGLIKKKTHQWKNDLSVTPSEKQLKRCFKNIYSISNTAKYRSFQYRLLHRAIVTNIHLQKWKVMDNDECTFCEKSRETYHHLFLECGYVKELWNFFRSYCQKQFDIEIHLDAEHVLLNNMYRKPSHPANVICLAIKQYIYRQRCFKKRPKVQELKAIVANIKGIEKYIAVKNGHFVKYISKWEYTSMNDDENRHVEMQNFIEYISEYNDNA